MSYLSEITANYSFVSIKLFFKTGTNNESYCDVILLVDDYNWIHDYKIKWKKLSLTKFTTASHFDKIRNSFRFKFREKILKRIGLKNTPNPHLGIKKNYTNLAQEQVNKINELFDKEWIGQSFSNIDYVITGSNATGQGKKTNSSFYTKFDNNQKFNIGFLFQSLRLTINKNELQCNEFKSIWEKYNSSQSNFKHYEFKDWLNHDHALKKDFLFFNQNLTEEQQQTKIKEIKKKYCPLREKFEEMDNLIRRNRQNLINKLNKVKKEFVSNFWNKKANINIKTIELAHIKPVRKIREESIANEFKKDILDEIKDINNILPLDANTHTLFDKHEICWNLNGEIFFINDKNSDESISQVFKHIPEASLSKIHKYLSWYINNYQEELKLQ